MTAPAPAVGEGNKSAKGSAEPFLVYICNACGLLYDERVGDPDSGLEPGTRFADIPNDWSCPLCGVSKDDFVLYQKIVPVSTRREAKQDARYDVHHSRQQQSQGAERGDATGQPIAFSGTTEGRTSRRSGRSDDGIVIVGAGSAGWQVAQALRERDATLAITLVTGCSGDLYDKPMLSVAHAKNIAPVSLVRERGVDAADRLRLRLRPHTFATGISTRSHWLRTTRGSLRYRKLILAQGARSRSLDNLPESLCWRINHLDAYLRFRRALETVDGASRQIIIVGAGLVGCELANDLALAGHRITLLDIGQHPLSAWLPQPAATALMAAWHLLPIKFIGNVAVASVAADGTRRVVTTVCGMKMIADDVIGATGLEVDRQIADSGALKWQNGIAVEASSLATSAPDVYALGDCISIDGKASRYIEPIMRQAQAIAADITGVDPAPYVPRSPLLLVKTSSCALRLEGTPVVDGIWRIDQQSVVGTQNKEKLQMSQWHGETLLARLKVG